MDTSNVLINLYADFVKKGNNKMNKKWSEVEKQYVIAHYNNSTDLQLCQSLQALGSGHSLDSVRKFRQRLNLKKAKGRPAKIKQDAPLEALVVQNKGEGSE